MFMNVGVSDSTLLTLCAL